MTEAEELRYSLKAEERIMRAWLLWLECGVVGPQTGNEIATATYQWVSDPMRAGREFAKKGESDAGLRV